MRAINWIIPGLSSTMRMLATIENPDCCDIVSRKMPNGSSIQFGRDLITRRNNDTIDNKSIALIA
jgi:hypothetical protein